MTLYTKCYTVKHGYSEHDILVSGYVAERIKKYFNKIIFETIFIDETLRFIDDIIYLAYKMIC